MNKSLKQAIIQVVKQHWETDNLLEAGTLLFERIPPVSRPLWGADILEFASQRVPKIPEIENVITFAREPHNWADSSESKRRDAHNFFDAIRIITLGIGRNEENSLYGDILFLGENVAKITYNAYGYDAPFDHDAGWWILANLKTIVAEINDKAFSKTAWEVLSNEAYIELETATRCNLYCTSCGWLKTFEITE